MKSKAPRLSALTAVEMVLETRGHDHAERVLKTLQEEGYQAQVIR